MIRHVAQEARDNPGLVGLAAVGASKGLWEVAVKPFFQEHPGALGWGLTLGCVTAFDAWALSTKHETMSQAFRTAYESPNPIYKFMCLGSIGALTVHLCQPKEATLQVGQGTDSA